MVFEETRPPTNIETHDGTFPPTTVRVSQINISKTASSPTLIGIARLLEYIENLRIDSADKTLENNVEPQEHMDTFNKYFGCGDFPTTKAEHDKHIKVVTDLPLNTSEFVSRAPENMQTN